MYIGKIKNGIVEDEHGIVVCVLTKNANEFHKALIKNASDMFDAILDYKQRKESTNQKNSKKNYDRLKKIEEKFNYAAG